MDLTIIENDILPWSRSGPNRIICGKGKGRRTVARGSRRTVARGSRPTVARGGRLTVARRWQADSG